MASSFHPVCCISPDETGAIFGDQGFSVSLKHKWYRSALVLEQRLANRQGRTSVAQPPRIDRISYFVRAVNRWLPPRGPRLLWVDHWEIGTYGDENAIVELARLGWGEHRPMEDAPGFLFQDEDWLEEDQMVVSPRMTRALGLLVGIASILMATGSDGWLISSGSTDRVEFWEGNIFFYSADPARVQRAEDIINEYACPRELVAEPRTLPYA